MLAAVILSILVAFVALDQTLRLARADSSRGRRVRFVLYGVVFAVGLAVAPDAAEEADPAAQRRADIFAEVVVPCVKIYAEHVGGEVNADFAVGVSSFAFWTYWTTEATVESVNDLAERREAYERRVFECWRVIHLKGDIPETGGLSSESPKGEVGR